MDQHFTEAERQALDTIRTSCADLFVFLADNMKIMISNWEAANDHRENGKPLTLRRTKEYPGQVLPEEEPDQPDKTGCFTKAIHIISTYLPWLGATLGKLLGMTFLDTKPQWVSFSPPPVFQEHEESYEDADGLKRVREYNAALRGIAGRYIIPLKALTEKIQADDKALLDCYRYLLKLPRRLSGNEWKLLLKVFDRNGIEAPINAQEVDDLHLGGLKLCLKKSIRRFPAVGNLEALRAKVKAQADQ